MQKNPWYLIIMVFAFIVTGLVGEAYAKSSYLTTFNTTYPTAPTTIKNCTLCHPGGATNQLNGYANASKSAAYNYKSIESLDSDADGFTNIVEINAGTYPGLATSVPATPPPVTVTLASLAISGPASVNENGTATYVATATMSNGTTKVVTATWSENSAAATISAAGVLTTSEVTANQAVTVSASYAEGGVTRTASHAVSIVDVPVIPPPVVTPPPSNTSDSDSDGMPNNFEQAYGLNPNDPADAGLDLDGDGLSNLNEYLAGTDPKNPDTDNDGVWDGEDLAPHDKNRPIIDMKGQKRYGAWFMDDGNKQWNRDKDVVSTNFGSPMDLPIVGDWNGNGIDKVGVYRNGKWFLDNNANDSWDPGVDSVAVFGAPTDLPVAGDWNGNGKTKIGVYRGGTWYLDNGNGQWDSGLDTVAVFGKSTDLPVTGDLNGDGRAEIGVYRPETGEWFFDRDNNGFWGGCDVDLCAGPFGVPSDIPVMGDWNGDGKYEAGVYRQGVWYLDNGNFKWDPNLDKTYTSFGAPYDVPVIGDWNNDGKSDIGTFR